MSRGSGTVVRGTVEYRNTAEPCEDMPRKSLDIRFTDYPVPQKRGLLRPFPAFRRGRVRAEPANGSRDESLVGFGATPQGLKTINICNFQGSLEPVFSAQFFHRLLDTTIFYACNTSERDILIARKDGQRAVRGKPRPPPSIMRKGKSLDWLPTHRILMPRPAATSLKDAMVSSKCFWASSTVRYMAVPPIFSTASQ